MSTEEQIISRIRRIAEIKPQIKSSLDALCTTLDEEADGLVFDSGQDIARWAGLIAVRGEDGAYIFDTDPDLGTVVRSRIPYQDRAWNKLGFPREPDIVSEGFAYARDYILSKGGQMGAQPRPARITGNFKFCGMDMTRVSFFPGPSMLDTSGVTSWADAFRDNNTLLEMGERLDVSGARYETSLSLQPCARMFLGCRSLKALPEMDFSGIRLETGINSSSESLFAGCSSLEDATGLLNYGAYDSTAGAQFNALFFRCMRLKRLPSIDWSYARSTNTTFSGCGIEEVDMGGWEMGRVTSMVSMFSLCGSLRRVVWPRCPMVVSSLRGVLFQCISLEEADFRGLDTAAVTDMSNAVGSCPSLKAARFGDLMGISATAGEWNVGGILSGDQLLEVVEFHGPVRPEVLMAVLRSAPKKKEGQALLRVGVRPSMRAALESDTQWGAIANNYQLYTL